MADKKTSPKTSVFWAVLNDLRGVLDPEFNRLAEWLAGRIPEGSFLRSDSFKRAFGVIKQHIERKGSSIGPSANFFLEAFTDLGDYLTAALGGEIKEKGAGSPADGWIKQFLKGAGERLKKSPNPAEEVEKIKQEFTCRLELLKFVESSTASPKKETTPSKFNWEEFEREFIKFLDGVRNSELNKRGAKVIRDFRMGQKWLRHKKGETEVSNVE